jgi:protoheme IX farnesyltransferase
MVLISAAVGFHLATSAAGSASGSGSRWVGLLYVLIGTGLTAAASAVINQWIEIDRDRRMPRTRNRPLPAGRISPREALIFGVILGIAGLTFLALFTNLLTFWLGVGTLVSYLAVYTPLKTRSTLNTIVGAVPGALPPVMGYAAGAGVLGPGAVALFGILFLWQMPHFLAIATLYREDYRVGGYRMLPVVDPDLSATSRQILIYCAALLLVSITPSLFGLTGILYAASALLLGTGFAMAGGLFALTRSRQDARTLFFASIIYLPLLLVAMVLDKN